jgi:polyisoprenoid-binding protein YceI
MSMRLMFAAAAFVLSACATPAPPPAPGAIQPSGVASPIPAVLSADPGTSLDPADAPAGAYTMDSRHASVIWRVRHTGLSLYTARFDTVSGTLAFDPQNPANSAINATIAANSVSTGLLNREGQRGFDQEIARTLGAGDNPNITFVSRSVQTAGPTTGLVTGELTLNGQTRPATLEVTFQGGRFIQLRQKHVLAFSARTIIRRSEFGVTNWGPFVGDDVEVLIEAEFVKD